MKDALGQPLQVGDEILYADVHDGSLTFRRAKVKRFTPKKISITYIHTYWQTGKQRPVNTLTSPTRVVLYRTCWTKAPLTERF